MAKTYGKRLVPEYLITKLEELEPGGGDYTAGTGIEISDENEISVDTDTIATKEYVDQHAGTTYTAGNGIDIDANNEISVDTNTIATVSALQGFTQTFGAEITAIYNGTTTVGKARQDASGRTFDEYYASKSELFSGNYNDLTNKPDLSVYELAADAFSGDYDDLTNKPDLSIYAESADLATVATTGAYSDLSGTPTLATVATTGDYDDLTNKPTIPTVDYPVTDVKVNGSSVVSSKIASITVPTKVSDLTNDSGYITSVAWGDVTGKPIFATVATSGDYDDLTNKPIIPAAQVNADWNAASGVAQILNKPSLASVATSGSYNDLSNKPSIPTTATSTSTVTPTTETLTFTYSDNTTGTITFITAATVSTTTTLS